MGHSLAVVSDLRPPKTVSRLGFSKIGAVNKSSVLTGGDCRPSLEHSLAVVSDLRDPKIVYSLKDWCC